MDYRDLAFGDWIQVERGYDGHLTNERVKGVIGDEDEPYPVRLFTEETVSLNDIHPIPLTKEILVKNGFEKNDRGDFVIDDTIVIAKENYCPKNYYACTWYQEDFDDEIYYIGICELTFVHQLQHLLRLCGIEKEIEL